MRVRSACNMVKGDDVVAFSLLFSTVALLCGHAWLQKRLEALRRDLPSDVDVSIDPSVSNGARCRPDCGAGQYGVAVCWPWLGGAVCWDLGFVG